MYLKLGSLKSAPEGSCGSNILGSVSSKRQQGSRKVGLGQQRGDMSERAGKSNGG